MKKTASTFSLTLSLSLARALKATNGRGNTSSQSARTGHITEAHCGGRGVPRPDLALLSPLSTAHVAFSNNRIGASTLDRLVSTMHPFMHISSRM